MLTRALQSFGVVCLIILAAGVTWVLSWGMQYLCAITTTGPKFVLSSHAGNRLAMETVVMAFLMMLTIGFVSGEHGWDRIPVLIFWGGVCWADTLLMGGTQAFSDTVVTSTFTQVLYCIVTLLLGFVMKHIFLQDLKL